ncbi:MAG: UbiA family prenyltransferase [Pseudomonadota bacterium]
MQRSTLFYVLKELRPKQWVKNLLVFLPLVASHAPLHELWVSGVIAFLAFSALASAVYIINDISDIEVDRAHPEKRFRPIAAGHVSIKLGLIVAAGLTTLAIGLAWFLGREFLVVLIVYLLLTTAYSFWAKQRRLLDIIFLAVLYGIRVIGGAAATGLDASLWFLGFVGPVFLSLAAVKRLTEVTRLNVDGRVPGRAYAREDRWLILGIAVVSAVAGVLVFVGYSFSSAAEALYDQITFFQLAALALILWLSRMIWTAWIGMQSFDPITFALRDRVGLSCVICATVLVGLAI